MKKFSLIKENINLGRFSITDNEFKIYMREVDSIKNSMYPDEIEEVEGHYIYQAGDSIFVFQHEIEKVVYF